MRKIKDLDKKSFGLEFSHFSWALIYLVALAGLVFAVFMMLSMFRISSSAFHCFDDVDDIPYHRVGLLLGTSPQQAPGVPNSYFTARIEAASKLFKEHKIDYILASGDNRELSYNEPREMRRALIRAGVPSDRIVMDFAGIRTLDSVLRAKSVFMLQDLTVISQSFHNERALFIARNQGLDVDGFNAKEPDNTISYLKVRFREFFARIKCILDVYLLETSPHFYGDPIKIGDATMPVQPSNKPRQATSKPKALSDSAAAIKEAELIAKQRQLELEEQAQKEAEIANQREQTIHAQEDFYNHSIDDEGSEANEIGTTQADELSNAAQQEALREAATTAAGAIRQTGIPEQHPHAEQSHEGSRKTYGDPWE